MAAADHAKGISGRKIGRAGKFRDGFFARVDEVGIDFGIERIRADAEHAVFRLQNYVHAFWHVVGHQRGHANAQVDVVAVAQLQRNPPRNPFPFLIFGERHLNEPSCVLHRAEAGPSVSRQGS